MHSALVQEWFGNTPPKHYFHNGKGIAWYVFQNAYNGTYLIMLADQDGPLKAIGIADTYQEVTDLYNMVKAHNPDAEWLH